MNHSTHENEVATDWYELPNGTWSNILGTCDYETCTHVAAAFAFSIKYRQILHILEPLDLTDLLILTRHSKKSVKDQIKILATYVPLKSAVVSSSSSLSAEWLLRIPAMINLSKNTLEYLSCYLGDFSVLPRFPYVNQLRILWCEPKKTEEGLNIHWDLRSDQAAFLLQLPKVEKLSFWGYTTVDLSSIQMPQLKELSIDFQPLPGTLRTQNRLTFALPKDCLLDQLTVTGPKKQEYDTEGVFNTTTHIDLKSILHHCKSINISGSNVVFDINTNSELIHAAAAADCMVQVVALTKATTWTYIKIDLVNYLKDVDVDLPKMSLHHRDQGTVDVPMVNLTVPLRAAAFAAGQHIKPSITCVPLHENIMTSEEKEESEEEIYQDYKVNLITATLMIERQVKLR